MIHLRSERWSGSWISREAQRPRGIRAHSPVVSGEPAEERIDQRTVRGLHQCPAGTVANEILVALWLSFEGMDERNGMTVAKFTLAAGGYEFAIDGTEVTAALDGEWVVDEGSTPTEEPTPTTTPTPTTPTPTPVVQAKVRVKPSKVRAGESFKVIGRNLTVRKVSITLGGRELGTVKVKDGRFRVTKVAPKRLSGRTVLRLLDRDGDVVARTSIRVLKAVPA